MFLAGSIKALHPTYAPLSKQESCLVPITGMQPGTPLHNVFVWMLGHAQMIDRCAAVVVDDEAAMIARDPEVINSVVEVGGRRIDVLHC